MSIDMIFLNGGSSSGKSTIARELQEALPEPWLTFGVDTLLEAMPSGLIEYDSDGTVHAGRDFYRLETAWGVGIASIVRAGVGVIVDEVLLAGGAAQDRWRTLLDGLDVLWVGVQCEGAVAARREAERPDRVRGMAESQAQMVHMGVQYDLVLDTTSVSAADCARDLVLAAGLGEPGRREAP